MKISLHFTMFSVTATLLTANALHNSTSSSKTAKRSAFGGVVITIIYFLYQLKVANE
jgi:hypothetical protein